ncbi:cubilin-like [Saccostrea cucullata]|uniref:cubilin-like n=1 Tax=Saccostrea cuccullata TaxID=36930 RepID=UPI002ED27476
MNLFFFCWLLFQIRYGCNGKNETKNISGITGSLTSPGYPGNYPNNVNYTWILNTGHKSTTVNFTFDVFDLEANWFFSCSDFLEITEMDPCCYTAMRRCGQRNPFSQLVRGRLIRITFVSDGIDTAKGFSLTWIATLVSNLNRTLSSMTIGTAIQDKLVSDSYVFNSKNKDRPAAVITKNLANSKMATVMSSGYDSNNFTSADLFTIFPQELNKNIHFYSK